MKAILLLLLVAGAFSKVVFVSEISRHGARACGSIYNFTVDPTENFKTPMELSTFGMRQHFLIGSQVRKRYIEDEKLFSSRYNPSEVIFRTTDTTRTYESGLSQISGIFPPQNCEQTLTSFQQENAVPPVSMQDIDDIRKSLKDKALPNCHNISPIYSSIYIHTYDLVPQDTDCKAYIDVSEPMCNSKERRDMDVPYIKAMKPRFELFLNRTVPESEVGSLCSYLQFADYHRFSLIFNYTEEDLKNCIELDNTGLYCKSYGDERLWKIGAKSYLDKLVNSMEKIIAKNETHKAEFNFSHDTAVAIILSGLGYMTKINPQLASTLFVELHEENEEYFVTATFNDLPLTYGLCTEIKCKFETFKENVRQRTFPGTIEEVCFGKTTSFLEALLQKY